MCTFYPFFGLAKDISLGSAAAVKHTSDLAGGARAGTQCLMGISPAGCGSDCSGAPLLAPLYVGTNLAFNIAALNLLRATGVRSADEWHTCTTFFPVRCLGDRVMRVAFRARGRVAPRSRPARGAEAARCRMPCCALFQAWSGRSRYQEHARAALAAIRGPVGHWPRALGLAGQCCQSRALVQT